MIRWEAIIMFSTTMMVVANIDVWGFILRDQGSDFRRSAVVSLGSSHVRIIVDQTLTFWSLHLHGNFSLTVIDPGLVSPFKISNHSNQNPGCVKVFKKWNSANHFESIPNGHV